MDSVEFQVSAKTARLIGRENISGVDGAILELVKNGYDADAECVFVKFINPYNMIPNDLSFTEVKQNFDEYGVEIEKYYEIKQGKYARRDNLTVEEYRSLKNLFLSLSKIIVLDNGCGMSQAVLKSSWMNIGTDEKEINIESQKKQRIKTGAKGIGRFALDKLSVKSKVFTKSEEDLLIDWQIDWSQFDNVKLLNQVRANISTSNNDFINIVKEVALNDFDTIKSYNWTTGTAIVLSPIREFWNIKSYEKVNKNLQNINPLGNVDTFDVIVRNAFSPEFNYESTSQGISRDYYDYMIEAKFDGKDKIIIALDRNELDIQTQKVKVAYSNTDFEVYDLNDFWKSDRFAREKYEREDFNGKVSFSYNLNEILPKKNNNQVDEYAKVGPFDIKIFYLKNTKSSLEIVKDIQSRNRKKLLENFSGIKIYRDKFKVRPYGDEGIFYDWLNLSDRVQRSPAAASHESGNWRVSPNQVIGSVSISRITNSGLEDTANREGMNLNQEYYAFVQLIQGIFDKFEFDRQYPLREYANWLRAKKKIHGDKVQETYEKVMNEKQKTENTRDDTINIDKENGDENSEYSEDDLKDVIYSFGKGRQDEMTTNQILMVLSSAGVMAQTFSHEISRVASNLGSRGQHIREAINRILEYEPYIGDEDFNPYDMLDELNSTDALLADWVNLIMDSVNKENFCVQEVSLRTFLEQIREKWSPLLDKKYIMIDEIKCPEDVALSLPILDLHLILNNFLLNSAYFLEECDRERMINFTAYRQDGKIYLDMKNNGPELNEKFLQNPDEIFNAGVSSKEKGTGMGLWVAREAVNRNFGSLHVIPIQSGFMLRASWDN